MIHVRLRCHAELARYAPGGQDDVTLVLDEAEASLAALLARLAIPPERQRRVIVAVNDALVRDHAISLADGDQVDILTPMAGG